MQNEEGKTVDLYVPRKCSATNRIITAKDHASVQINIGHLDANGMYDGHFTTFALSGFVRAQVIVKYPCIQVYSYCSVFSLSNSELQSNAWLQLSTVNAHTILCFTLLVTLIL